MYTISLHGGYILSSVIGTTIMVSKVNADLPEQGIWPLIF